MDGGEVGEGDDMQSMTVEDLMPCIKALLKCMEEMWGNDPLPELVQCTVLMCWAASGVLATVEEEEGNLSKLEVVVVVGKMHIHEVHHVRQWWVDIVVYAEAVREVVRGKSKGEERKI
jgi:hypothetical protein